MILLTDEEMLAFIDRDKDACCANECCAIAKAQLKKVVEWLGEYDYGNAPTATQVVNWIKQALLKEIE